MGVGVQLRRLHGSAIVAAAWSVDENNSDVLYSVSQETEIPGTWFITYLHNVPAGGSWAYAWFLQHIAGCIGSMDRKNWTGSLHFVIPDMPP